MKRRLLILASITLCILFMSSGAMAGVINIGDYVRIETYNGLNGGGIISLDVSNLPSHVVTGSYETFCAALNESISAHVWYQVYDMVPLSGLGNENKAAYLFFQFVQGAFPGISKADQVVLQEAIWMGLGDLTPDLGNPYWADAVANAVSGKNYGVDKMILNPPTGRVVQSMLYQTPEPSILLLLGLGVCALGLISRKK